MSHRIGSKKIIEKIIITSGAVVRSLIGIGATALLFFGLKKKKKS